MSILKKGGRIMLIILSFLLVCMLIISGILMVLSPGKARPFLDCSYTEAKSYYEILKAPIKGFYTFEKSAHSPLFEEPEKMLHILKEDVLAGVNKLSDITKLLTRGRGKTSSCRSSAKSGGLEWMKGI